MRPSRCRRPLRCPPSPSNQFQSSCVQLTGGFATGQHLSISFFWKSLTSQWAVLTTAWTWTLGTQKKFEKKLDNAHGCRVQWGIPRGYPPLPPWGGGGEQLPCQGGWHGSCCALLYYHTGLLLLSSTSTAFVTDAISSCQYLTLCSILCCSAIANSFLINSIRCAKAKRKTNLVSLSSSILYFILILWLLLLLLDSADKLHHPRIAPFVKPRVRLGLFGLGEFHRLAAPRLRDRTREVFDAERDHVAQVALGADVGEVVRHGITVGQNSFSV